MATAMKGEGGDRAIKPVVSLPARARDGALRASFDAMVDGSGDVGAESCADVVYHTRLVVENGESSSDSGGGIEGSIDDENEGGHSSGGDDDGDDGVSDDECENEHDRSDKDARTSGVNAVLGQMLDEEKLGRLSIVYLAIQGVLIYDRNRGGLILTPDEERFLLYGDDIEDVVGERLDHLDGSATRADSDEPMRIHLELTHHLLDEILSFAETEAVAVLPRVCAAWRDEVGTRSPQPWRMLLRRHGWPMLSTPPADESGGGSQDALDECRRCKGAFVSHYGAVRDLRALAGACNHMTGGGGGNNLKGNEAALQVFKATKGAPELTAGEKECIVKIWTDANDASSTRALAGYPDLTLRLFEVDRGSGSLSNSNRIKCRQTVCVRAVPSSISRKKDGCKLLSLDLDDDHVACLIAEHDSGIVDESGDELTVPHMTVLSREDVICAGNEGILDDEQIQSFDLRGAILAFFWDGSSDTVEELAEALHEYLSLFDGVVSSDIHIAVTPKLVACGKGHFLFHAFIQIPEFYDQQDDMHHPECRGHRLFLFSRRDGSIVDALHLERFREGTSLFASRPFKRRERGSACVTSTLCTRLLVSGPTHELLSLSVEIRRDGTTNILRTSIIENEELAPWSKMNAVLTSSHTIFSTDPVQGPALHFISSHSNEHYPIALDDRPSTVSNMFILGDNYVGVIITKMDEDNDFDGHWFGQEESPSKMLLYHIPTRRQIFVQPMPTEPMSLECIGGTFATNVSNLGFVITGQNARDVSSRVASSGEADQSITSPSGKNPKGKKKRLASLASGRKKDGFARGMSLRG